MDERGFTILPPDNRGYPGMTKLPIGGTRELVALGTGPQVEAELVRIARDRGRSDG